MAVNRILRSSAGSQPDFPFAGMSSAGGGKAAGEISDHAGQAIDLDGMNELMPWAVETGDRPTHSYEGRVLKALPEVEAEQQMVADYISRGLGEV